MDNVISGNLKIEERHLQEGALILVDKPLTWTSFDVVNKIRYTVKHLLGVKKYKVGHAGTLDPLASGLLLLCIGKYTKKIEGLMGLSKDYKATVQLGYDTPSQDAELLPHIYYPSKTFDQAQVDQALMSFRGQIKQLPPMYSAIKVKGESLYKKARKGQVVERKERPVEIHSLQGRLESSLDLLHLEVSCSKGTYIRTLGHDIAHVLGTGGYLSVLRRTQIGPYSVSDAVDVQQLVTFIQSLSITSNEA